MWADRVVVAAPLLDDDLGFAEGEEDLPVQEFVSEARIEALAVAVRPAIDSLDRLLNGLTPRRAGLDVGGRCSDRRNPVPGGLGGELGAIV